MLAYLTSIKAYIRNQMFTVIKGNNRSLERQLAEALFGNDEKLIHQLLQQINNTPTNNNQLKLIVDNNKNR